ncbi:hypothetical protein FRB99_003559 [Tulasnella sp. 403]|nr:hypothetical protein FRB99_003559 [Tulasnella sp. 403]
MEDDYGRLAGDMDLRNVKMSNRSAVAVGGFGSLFRGVYPGHGKVALKRIEAVNEKNIRLFLLEAKVWRSLSHPHILPLLGTSLQDTHWHFVSPWAENGSLIDYLKIDPNVDRSRLLWEAADALTYLHEKKIIHGDVKARNILVSSTIPVHTLLCDFGLSRSSSVETDPALKHLGTCRWQSPELWAGGSKSVSSDVWAFGITIYEVLSGQNPFFHIPYDFAVGFEIVVKKGRPPTEPLTSPTGESYLYLWDVAEDCWEEEPNRRPTLEIVRSRLASKTRSRGAPSRNKPSARARSLEREVGIVAPVRRGTIGRHRQESPVQAKFRNPILRIRSFFTSILTAASNPLTIHLSTQMTVMVTSEDPVITSDNCDILFGLAFSMNFAQLSQPKKVALKRVRVARDSSGRRRQRDRLEHEAELWELLAHPRILQYWGIGADTHDVSYLASPYMENGSLRDYITKNGNCDRPSLLLETAQALDYLHDKGIIHGDVRARNILVTSDQHALVCGFSVSRHVEAAPVVEPEGAGNLHWRSPEIFRGEPTSFSGDVYSFGMTIYEVLSGKDPFQETLYAALITAIVKEGKRPPKEPMVSPTGLPYGYLWDIAECCWHKEPDERPTASSIAHRLQNVGYTAVG